MKISIDIDDTYTKDPECFERLIVLLKNAGHRVGALTGRTPDTIPGDNWDFKIGGYDLEKWPHGTDEERSIGKGHLMRDNQINIHFDNQADWFDDDLIVVKI